MTFASKAIPACVLLILVCIGVLSFRGEVRNEKDRQWVVHTLLVVEKLQAIRIDITEAETGQRAYMLTGQDRHLALYRAAVDRVRWDMKELPDLIQDNPGEREAIRRLAPLVTAELLELADGIEVRQHSGLLAGVDAVTQRSDDELWTELIAAQIGGMRRSEAQLLSARLQTAAASTRKIKAVIFLGNALAIAILLVKDFVIYRETGKRNRAEQSLKHSNERLERRTSELSETNIELESFAYSVAHDLRAPLRHIAGYSGALVQDYGLRIDAEGRRRLEKIEDGAQKMGRLVDDLLSLSRVGLQKLSLENTSLDSLIRQAMGEFAPECSARDIDWRIGELFSTACDPGLMKQVFVNLISNAVKYTGKRDHAVIEVGQIIQSGERVVFVRDNGAGFEMQYAGKLFGVFQRLHKARDFEGTGVGLAIVQRIIRKHGGRIWAEAEPDRGATFFFTLGSPEINPADAPELTIHEEVMHVGGS
jgi:signal transduction histidine kinase